MYNYLFLFFFFFYTVTFSKIRAIFCLGSACPSLMTMSHYAAVLYVQSCNCPSYSCLSQFAVQVQLVHLGYMHEGWWQKIRSWYNSLSLFVVCVGTATSRAQSLLLQKPAGDLEESSSFSSCPKKDPCTCIIPDIYLTLMCSLRTPAMKIAFLGKLLYALFCFV